MRTSPTKTGVTSALNSSRALRETDPKPPLRAVTWPAKPSVGTPANYPAVAAAITKIIAESATALARWKAHGQ